MSDNVQLTSRVRYSVYYEDTDFSGFVYHANYLKYFERGREELIGLRYLRDLYTRGLHFVVVHAELSFHKPAQHGDSLEIVTKMPIVKAPIVRVEHSVSRIPEDGGAPVALVSGAVKMAFISNGKLSSVPPEVMQHFMTLATDPQHFVP